jgi:hypothetical protein
VPRLRRSGPLGLISQPFRAGLTFGGRPSGPCIHGDLCSVISLFTCRRQVEVLGMTQSGGLGSVTTPLKPKEGLNGVPKLFLWRGSWVMPLRR